MILPSVPQDLLQIALEHHRAGRLTLAQSGYKRVLDDEPGNADAMHWLGVLYCQGGQLALALPLLESAVKQRPSDAAFQHNLGQAYLRAGNKTQAIQTLERAVKIAPQSPEALVALAQASISRGKPGDCDRAVAVLKQAQAAGFVTAESAHQLAMAQVAAGHFADAIATSRASIDRNRDDAAAWYHLALAFRGAGELKETRKALIKSLELDSSMAPGWCALAMLDAEAGNLSAAAGLFRRAVAADRNYPPAHEGLARVLGQSGDTSGARAAIEQARGSAATASAPASIAQLEQHLTPTPEQAQVHFAMAAIMKIFPPMQTPNASISGLFDRYAERFDEHLVGRLEYHVPEALLKAITPFWNGEPLDVFDAGCGTGLCGALLRPMARTLVGVDLSSAMIDKATERGIYDRLEVGELIDTLRKSPGSYDLLVCADVLIYVGDSAPFFEVALAALRPGGLLAYSVEACGGERYELIPHSRRFTHSKPYIQRLAKIYGFEELHFQSLTVRKERDQPVTGYLVVLRSPRA